MGKAFLFILTVFFFASIGAGVLAGENTFLATYLTSSVTATSSTLPGNATNWPTAGNIQLDQEIILYGATDGTGFKTLTRGAEGTKAVAHASGAVLYQEEAGMANSVMGFDVVSVAQNTSVFSVVLIPLFVITVTIPHLASVNWNFLQGQWAIVGIFWYMLLASLVISFAIALKR